MQRRNEGWLVNPSRVRIRDVNARFARRTEPGMLVLDAGAGRQPYRDLFGHARYESADFSGSRTQQTYVCDLTDIPVADARYDRVICNQVLEHVPDPPAVVAELARVTKDGGRILVTVPFFFHLHQRPHDYYRYTGYALRRLFTDAGFRITRLEWLEGYFAAVSLQFRHMGSFLPAKVRGDGRRGLRWLAAAAVIHTLRASSYLLAGLFARLDLRWKYEVGYPKNYLVLATRRPRSPVA